MTAERLAFDLALNRGLATVSLIVRQVPESQPSPVVSFSTAWVAMTTVPASRGSELVDVPRQTAFVTDSDEQGNVLGTAHADYSPFRGSTREKIPAAREEFGCGT